MNDRSPASVLVFSRTTGYRHDSVEAGVACIAELGRQHGFRVDTTEDAGWFTDQRLADYDVVVWMQVSGIVLDTEQREAYGRFTSNGGGFVAVHAASDAERHWPLFDELVGARFESHPPGVSPAELHRTLAEDPSTRSLPASWSWVDEWYRFDRDPRSGSEVLLTVSSSVFGQREEKTMDNEYPVTWRRTVGAARAWYTSLGHQPEAYSDERFRAHLLGGIQSATGGVR